MNSSDFSQIKLVGKIQIDNCLEHFSSVPLLCWGVGRYILIYRQGETTGSSMILLTIDKHCHRTFYLHYSIQQNNAHTALQWPAQKWVWLSHIICMHENSTSNLSFMRWGQLWPLPKWKRKKFQLFDTASYNNNLSYIFRLRNFIDWIQQNLNNSFYANFSKY